MFFRKVIPGDEELTAEAEKLKQEIANILTLMRAPDGLTYRKHFLRDGEVWWFDDWFTAWSNRLHAAVCCRVPYVQVSELRRLRRQAFWRSLAHDFLRKWGWWYAYF